MIELNERDKSCEKCLYWHWKPIQGCYCTLTRELQDYWNRCEKFKPTEKYLRELEDEA